MSLPRSLAITVIAAWWTIGCTRSSLPTPTASASEVPSPTASGTSPAIETPTAEMPEPPTPVAATPAPASVAIAHFSPGTHLVVSWIQMVDATTGWATGGRGDVADHVARTADGGVTWSDVTPPEEAPCPISRRPPSGSPSTGCVHGRCMARSAASPHLLRRSSGGRRMAEAPGCPACHSPPRGFRRCLSPTDSSSWMSCTAG